MNKSIDSILKFNKVRHWDNAKPIHYAKSIVIESAELLELFQWTEICDTQKASHEAADIFIYLIGFCNSLGIDINTAVEQKILLNAKKYPAKEFEVGVNNDFYFKQKKKYRLKK